MLCIFISFKKCRQPKRLKCTIVMLWIAMITYVYTLYVTAQHFKFATCLHLQPVDEYSEHTASTLA